MCIRPKPTFTTIVKEIDEKTGEIVEKHKKKFLPIWKLKERDPVEIEWVNCGTCSECRISKSKDWSARCYLESLNWPKNCFITLTYNNENLPKNRSLVKRDLQLFWKNLRKRGYKVRYMACGEYGPTTLRRLTSLSRSSI